LATRSRIAGVQGFAGTAKTTTVLATFATEARRRGLNVRAFAPTAAAASILGAAIDTKAETVAALLQAGGAAVPEIRRAQAQEAWIIDEASMISAKDMAKVLDLSRRAGARVVLVGDVKQLGSVEAGRAFGQLQEAGMETFKLDEIVRQSNEATREAVVAMVDADGRRALDALDRGGGRIIEHVEADARYAAIARDFAGLAEADRAATIVMDPTRQGREHLTAAIRRELRQAGVLGEEAISVATLEPRDMTREQAARAASYETGDVVCFRRDYDARGVKRGETYRVAGTDAKVNRITLQDSGGRQLVWDLNRWGKGQADAFVEVEREFRVGDRLAFTRNDHAAGRINGTSAVVTNVNLEAGVLVARDAQGREHTMHATRAADRHFRHGWVSTIHAAQGATADRVMAHLEAFRANAVNAASIYVSISRARKAAVIYTDNREHLGAVISGRQAMAATALDVPGPVPLGMVLGSEAVLAAG
jgi:ATP-dependent exoDNAse (exonuclease V) alpha subunit